LYFQPQEGRASVATITIRTPDDEDHAVAVAAADATIDAVDTTTDAAAGESEDNRRLIPLVSTASIETGQRYILTDTTGVSEWVEVESITSGESVTAKSDLEHDYSSGASFVGTRLSYVLAAENTTEALKDTDFRAEWTYTVDGTEYIHDTFYDVVRAPWYQAATMAGFEAFNREVFARAKDDNVALTDILAESWDDVLRRIEAKGWRPGLIIGMERLAPVTYAVGVLRLAEIGYRPSGYTGLESWISFAEQRVSSEMEMALAGVQWYDKQDDAERTPEEVKPAMSSVRVVF